FSFLLLPFFIIFPYTTLFRSCPSRALIHESIYDEFIERALERVKKIKIGHPLDTETMMGAQASTEQLEKIKSYLEIGKEEGAELDRKSTRLNSSHVSISYAVF